MYHYGNIMLTIFLDMETVILVCFTPNGETAYCDVLQTKLKPATRSNAMGNFERMSSCCMTTPVLIWPLKTVKTVNELGFELMEHPPYSPDLVPSNFHVFGPMKEALRGR
jgi:histone-lysine N-methyltransferase SETMAR